MAQALFARRSVSLTGGAAFGGLAALSTVIFPANIQPPFPILPFLRFDPAELFSVMAFLIFGPVAGAIAATSHWIFLTATGTDSPLGPAAKFASVLFTLFGLWLGGRIYDRLQGRIASVLGLMLVCAAAARIGIMIIVNYFIFTYIGPVLFGLDYLGFSQQVLQATLHVNYGGPLLLTAVLFFTSIFNLMHTAFSVLVPYLIFTPLTLKVPQIASGRPWISRFSSH